MEDHVATHEQQRELVYCLRIRLYRQSALEFGIQLVHHVALNEQRRRFAVHAPIGKSAATVHYYDAARSLK